jgi:hypothetical protein
VSRCRSDPDCRFHAVQGGDNALRIIKSQLEIDKLGLIKSSINKLNNYFFYTFAMLAKRPESVSLNWSLQSRAKRAIKKILLEINSIRKLRMFIVYKTRKFLTSFLRVVFCSKDIRRQASVDLKETLISES